jgi:hypothetical protein
MISKQRAVGTEIIIVVADLSLFGGEVAQKELLKKKSDRIYHCCESSSIPPHSPSLVAKRNTRFYRRKHMSAFLCAFQGNCSKLSFTISLDQVSQKGRTE